MTDNRERVPRTFLFAIINTTEYFSTSQKYSVVLYAIAHRPQTIYMYFNPTPDRRYFLPARDTGCQLARSVQILLRLHIWPSVPPDIFLCPVSQGIAPFSTSHPDILLSWRHRFSFPDQDTALPPASARQSILIIPRTLLRS